MIVSDHAAAERILTEALSEYPNNQALVDEMFQYCLTQSDRLGSTRQNLPEQVRLLKMAITLKPQDMDGFVRLAKRAKEPGPGGDLARQTAGQLVSDGIAPPLLLGVVGTELAGKGDYAAAIVHLRRAVQADPDNAPLLNNLAWVMWKQSERDTTVLSEALQMAEKAVSLQPDTAVFLETRGQLYLKLGRYDQAIADLRRAINGIADDASIHAALAEAYEKTGQLQLARTHRQQRPQP